MAATSRDSQSGCITRRKRAAVPRDVRTYYEFRNNGTRACKLRQHRCFSFSCSLLSSFLPFFLPPLLEWDCGKLNKPRLPRNDQPRKKLGHVALCRDDILYLAAYSTMVRQKIVCSHVLTKTNCL